MRQLIVEPEFRDKIPALSPEEFSKLEENILADGEVRDPLVVWDNTIIDGHNRWAIIQRHPDLKWTVKQMEFPDKWAAIVWMCRNQLGRRNMTPQQRDYIIKQEYEAQAKTHGGDRGSQRGEDGRFSASEENLHLRDKRVKTRNIVADAHGIGLYEVQSAVEFGRGLDAAEAVSPGIRDAVLSGEVKAPKKVIAEIRNLPEEKQKAPQRPLQRFRGRGGVLYPPTLSKPSERPQERNCPYSLGGRLKLRPSGTASPGK